MKCAKCFKVMHEESYSYFWCDCGIYARVYNGGTTIFYDEDDNVYYPQICINNENIKKIEREIDDWKNGK